MRVKNLAFPVLLLAPGAVLATTLTVNNTGDSGPGNCATVCTLRDAIAVAAASGDTLAFSLSLPNTINLSHEVVIVKSMTLQGPGAAQLAISAGNIGRVLNVSAGNVQVTDLTVRDGSVPAAQRCTGRAIKHDAAANSNPAFGLSREGGTVHCARSGKVRPSIPSGSGADWIQRQHPAMSAPWQTGASDESR